MRRNGTALVMVVALIVAFLGLGIAYAAFSTTLTINGSATVESSSWKVVYTKTSTATEPASTGVSITPTITGTATGSGTLTASNFTWNGTFTTPGDKLVYSFYIRNLGDYDAKITNINTPTLTCKKGTDAETDVCSKITYAIYRNSALTTKLAKGYTLAAGSSVRVYLVAELTDTFQEDGSDLPSANISVTPSTISIVWEQV